MDEQKFWAIIEAVHRQANGDMDEKSALVKNMLSQLSKEDAKKFAHIFDDKMDQAYSWPLWGAAYVIAGGCGDDAFMDFRASLISRGQTDYDAAILDPETLATLDLDTDDWFFEGYQYAVTDGVEAAVGVIVDRQNPHPTEPSGVAWDEDHVYDDYPELSAKYA